jgi:hypothetical protein
VLVSRAIRFKRQRAREFAKALWTGPMLGTTFLFACATVWRNGMELENLPATFTLLSLSHKKYHTVMERSG